MVGERHRCRARRFLAKTSRGLNLVTALQLALVYGGLTGAAVAQQAVRVIRSPGPIERNNNADCSFALGHCAQVTSSIPNATVNLTNSGSFDAGLSGIFTLTDGTGASIAIENAGGIKAGGHGISATALGGGSDIILSNRGAIAAGGDGISSLIFSFGTPGSLWLENRGDIRAGGYGIFAETASNGGELSIDNSGGITSGYVGLFAFAPRDGSRITVKNTGPIAISGPSDSAHGIYAETTGIGGALSLENGGAITTKGASASGIFAQTSDTASPIDLNNAGNLQSTVFSAEGITASTTGIESTVAINNTGHIAAGSYGISAASSGASSPLTIANSGVIDPAVGLYLVTTGPGSPLRSVTREPFMAGRPLSCPTALVAPRSTTPDTYRRTRNSPSAWMAQARRS